MNDFDKSDVSGTSSSLIALIATNCGQNMVQNYRKDLIFMWNDFILSLWLELIVNSKSEIRQKYNSISLSEAISDQTSGADVSQPPTLWSSGH